jgi:hypothetical protein
MPMWFKKAQLRFQYSALRNKLNTNEETRICSRHFTVRAGFPGMF